MTRYAKPKTDNEFPASSPERNQGEKPLSLEVEAGKIHGEAMNDEQKQELLHLWRVKKYLTYFEALALLRGFFPELEIQFAEERAHGRIKHIKQVLEDDIEQFGLRVYFDVWYDYGSETHLDEPDYATAETLNHFIPSGDIASWWAHGKVLTQDLRDWLQNKGISSVFFETTASPIPNESIAKRMMQFLPFSHSHETWRIGPS